MQSSVVRVPDALLFHRHLGKSAKLLWIVLQHLGGDAIPRTGLLLDHSGLARHTVLRALAELRTWGWLPPSPDQGRAAVPAPAAAPATAASPPAAAGPDQAGACLPADLLPDRHVGIQAKLLYACLQRIAGPRSPRGQCTCTQLCQLTGTSPNTVKRALRSLQATGWLELSQRNKFSPIHFLLCNPAAGQRKAAVDQMARRVKATPHRGEALMRAYLSLIVDSDEHDDDASPAFLVNPFTGEELQFDRYYPPGVALEFNGRQHYERTQRYPDEVQLLKQQARDYIKQGICAARGIHLIVVHAEDLSLERMREKVAGRLPLRDLAGYEAVVAYLEARSRSYRREAREGRFRSA